MLTFSDVGTGFCAIFEAANFFFVFVSFIIFFDTVDEARSGVVQKQRLGLEYILSCWIFCTVSAVLSELGSDGYGLFIPVYSYKY